MCWIRLNGETLIAGSVATTFTLGLCQAHGIRWRDKHTETDATIIFSCNLSSWANCCATTAFLAQHVYDHGLSPFSLKLLVIHPIIIHYVEVTKKYANLLILIMCNSLRDVWIWV